MIVLGIDPGTANTGFGLVERRASQLIALDGGVLRTSPSQRTEARLAEIHAGVSELLDAYNPTCLALEDIYFGVNVRSAFAIGQARGVVMLAAAVRGIPCRSYTPQQVKSAVCGTGRADKDQVQRMVQTLLSLLDLPRPDHAADALAVAICDLNAAPLSAALARAGVR